MIILPKVSSVFKSWKFIKEDFSSVYEVLSEHKDEYQREIIWKTRHKFVARVYLPESLGGGSVAYKFYRNARPFRYFMQYSQAYREGCGFYIAHVLNIPTVQALAIGEKRFCGYLKNSFFISRFAEGYQAGAALLLFAKERKQPALLMDFIRKNLSYLARLHRAGFSHGGPHYNNFLWKLEENGKMEVCWLDLATVRRLPWLGRRRKIRADIDMFLNCFSLNQEEIQELHLFYQRVYHRTEGYS